MNINKATVEYSKNQIRKAGKELILNPLNKEAMKKLSYWRGLHIDALDLTYSIIGKIAKVYDKDVLLAKRLKRTDSIVKKLHRFQKSMQLITMQDIGGCRIIVKNRKKINKIIKELIKDNRFKVVKNYIDNPNDRGYRSIHLIGTFPGKDGSSKCIEIQIRTHIQHSWATAVEIIDLFTDQSIKTNSGSEKWKQFFKSTSNLFVNLEDNPYLNNSMNQESNPNQSMDRRNAKLVLTDYSEKFHLKKNDNNFIKDNKQMFSLCAELDLFNKMKLYAKSIQTTEKDDIQFPSSGFILIIITLDDKDMKKATYTLNYKHFSKEMEREAIHEYLVEERKTVKEKNYITALIASESVGGIKEAYPNYFADSQKFIHYLNIITNIYKLNTLWIDRVLYSALRIFK